MRCVKWIVEISREKDLTINLHHVMDFSSVQMFEAVMLNTGAVVHIYGEYLEEAIRRICPIRWKRFTAFMLLAGTMI